MSNDIEWKMVKLGDVAEFLPTNTLSRDELNYSEGEYLNIHYGDVLIKYGSIVSKDDDIPRIKKEYEWVAKIFLKKNDIVVADTAEDESVGKVTQIGNIDFPLVGGLHTII